MFNSKLGKEFKFINSIIKNQKLKYLGDDCAIVNNFSYTIDNYIEDVHFSRKYYTFKEIGIKAIEASISDIAAMGEKPLYTLIGISAKNIKIIKEIYKSVFNVLKPYKIQLIGGDTTFSEKIHISVVVIGTAKSPRYRSNARENDLIYITSYTGFSGAGFFALKNKIPGFLNLKNKHKQPKAKIKEGIYLNKYVNSMIDISDGLASELYHISDSSNCSIHIDDIPIHKDIKKISKKLKINENYFPLYGGEDFELLYTIPKKHEKHALGFKIGLVKKGTGVYYKGKILKIKGFQHF